MAIALRRIRDRIRFRLRDFDATNGSYTGPEYDQYICDAYLAMQSRLHRPDLYTSSAFTISAGTDLFSLPATVLQYTGNDGGAEYAGDVRIRLRSTGDYLVKNTVEELDAWRDGDQNVVLAIPRHFALWEDKDQAVQGRCHPGAKVAELCDLFAPLTADDLRDFVGGGTSDLDDVEVLFSRVAAQALVYGVAAELLLMMPDDEATRRRINKAVVQKWERMSEVMLDSEEARRHDVEDVGRVQRWQS